VWVGLIDPGPSAENAGIKARLSTRHRPSGGRGYCRHAMAKLNVPFLGLAVLAAGVGMYWGAGIRRDAVSCLCARDRRR